MMLEVVQRTFRDDYRSAITGITRQKTDINPGLSTVLRNFPIVYTTKVSHSAGSINRLMEKYVMDVLRQHGKGMFIKFFTNQTYFLYVPSGIDM